MIKIGAFEIITPLGASLDENWEAIESGKTSLQKVKYNDKAAAYISRFESADFRKLIAMCFEQMLEKIEVDALGKTQVIFSSTKGAVGNWNHYHKHRVYEIQEVLDLNPEWDQAPITVSNACISGLQAVEFAYDGIQFEHWDSAIVVAFDEVSEFIVEGFASLHALSKGVCQPFSKDRDGINIGSAIACAVVSKNPVFKGEQYRIVGASNCNDANHISGPSRTGEGLYRAISNVLKKSAKPDFISLHGTGTPYNDEMEAVALDRLGLTNIPVHSLKPVFGHTLGAAGLLELAICGRMLTEQKAVPSLNYKKQGTSVKLNVQSDFGNLKMNRILKTTSGFGGNNAALLIQRT